MTEQDKALPADDVEGNFHRAVVDVEQTEDVEGNLYRFGLDMTDGEDTSGHLSGALGAKKRDGQEK